MMARWSLSRIRNLQAAYRQSLNNCSPRPFSTNESAKTSSKSDKAPETACADDKQQPKGDVQGPVTWKSLAVIAAVGTGGLIYYSRERERRMKEIMSPKTVGRAAIGGPIKLVDEDGKEFNEEDLKGRWTLVYFGFTMCPDICPDELTKVSEALVLLQKRGKIVQSKKSNDNSVITPIFISIDPERDSPARAAEYAKAFHPAFIGVSGSIDQVTAAAKTYRVYFSKDETQGDDYLVDHSIITYLMDPAGEFQDFYGKNASASEVAARMETTMVGWSPPSSK